MGTHCEVQDHKQKQALSMFFGKIKGSTLKEEEKKEKGSKQKERSQTVDSTGGDQASLFYH